MPPSDNRFRQMVYADSRTDGTTRIALKALVEAEREERFESAMAVIKRRLREWPTCSIGGQVIVMPRDCGTLFFRCTRCSP
jgi:hypothetical protein